MNPSPPQDSTKELSLNNWRGNYLYSEKDIWFILAKVSSALTDYYEKEGVKTHGAVHPDNIFIKINQIGVYDVRLGPGEPKRNEYYQAGDSSNRADIYALGNIVEKVLMT